MSQAQKSLINLTAVHKNSNTSSYQVNESALVQKLSQKEVCEIAVPTISGDKEIVLHQVQIFSDDYQLFSSEMVISDTKEQFAFFHGYVSDNPSSKVTLTLQQDKLLQLSISDHEGNFEINRTDKSFTGSFGNDYIAKNIENTVSSWDCQALEPSEEDILKDAKAAKTNKINTSECTTIFFEVDHNMYNKKGSIAATEAWVATLMNQVAILFIEWDVPLTVSGIQVWDTPDPYVTAANTSEALGLFRNAVHNNPNFNGRLAHLLSGRGLGGGIAYLSSLCSNFTNVAVSANLSSSAVTYPNYSWNVMVIAHELGHNFGSPHTHDCVWNGDNTAIDGCGPISGCPDLPNPPNNVGGTIMSYCHLTSAGINFNNGFGPQPGALIQDRFDNASCVTGVNCVPVPPFNDVCARATSISLINHCINSTFSLAASSSSAEGTPDCGSPSSNDDIWYEFDFPSTDSIMIELEALPAGTGDMIIEIYEGTCGSPVLVECAVSSNQNTLFLTLDDPALIGKTLFCRIMQEGTDTDTDFRFCIYNPSLPCSPIVDSLEVIYNSLQGTSWTLKNGWENASSGYCSYCNWYGVTCDLEGNIVSLDLESNNLTGPLPATVFELQDLIYLDLSHNNLSSALPNTWDSLSNLFFLDLSNNQLTGSVPESFKFMNKINTIYLDQNLLSGAVTPYLSSNSSLRSFSASNNQFTGCFPAGLNNFCYRDSLNLDNNPGMVFGGDVSYLCEEFIGQDNDEDGFCNGVGDCNDYDSAINPGVAEVPCDAIDNNCDGIMDDPAYSIGNAWIGPDTLGVWQDSSNWSLGYPPKPCEIMEVGLDNTTIHLELDSPNYSSTTLRSIRIGENTTLHIKQNASITLRGGGQIENYGHLLIENYFSIQDQDSTGQIAIYNEGRIDLLSNSGMGIDGIGTHGIHNTPSGEIFLDGWGFIGSNEPYQITSGILNEGYFHISGYLSIYGEFDEAAIEQIVSSYLELGPNSTLETYESSGGGNGGG